MVRAEMIYNPYLLETEVRFNGNPPRINSLVEKYQGKKLQTWVNDVPAIFYNEMNGFDFELDFSGPELDFNELKRAFIQAGVGKDLVQLFHKGKLESRHAKSLAIDDFLQWLEENPNRKFDLAAFRTKNRDLFESAYSFVVIGGTVNSESIFPNIDISIENVASVDELRKTDLYSTPILLYLDHKSVMGLQNNLLELLKRDDISQEQLFFMITPALGEKVERVIRDLGVRKPQVVKSPGDFRIYRYIELFPVSDYIYEAIRVFREEADEIGAILEEENRQNEITNRDIHEQIKNLDDILTRLKEVNDLFVNRDNMDMPLELTKAKEDLIDSVNRWKIRKTKITKTEEARSLSYEYESELFRLFDDFKQNVDHIYSFQSIELLNRCKEWFRGAHYNEEYTIEEIKPLELSEYSIERIANELLKIKEEQYVMPKEDLFGKFFKSADNTAKEPVLETTYYYEKWRSYAVETVEPVADEIIREVYSNLQVYYEQLSSIYTEHIGQLLQEVSEEKEQVSSQLSEDEQLLQADKDWHTTFCDILREIERA